MNTKRKWLSAVTVAALALGLGGFVASQAQATDRPAPPNDGKCYVWVDETTKTIDNPDYVPGKPAVPGVPAVTELVNYEWNGGNTDTAPAWPDTENWGVNHGEHNGVAHQPKVDGNTYKTNDNPKGTANWFHWGLVIITPEVPAIPAVPAVGEPTIVVVDEPGHYNAVPCAYPLPTQFSAAPGDPSCLAAGEFATAFLGEPASTEGAVSWYDFENVWVQIDRSVEGQVYILVQTKAGFTLTDVPEGWTGSATSIERVILLPAQLSGEEACPTDEPPVDEPPVDEPPVDNPPVDNPPTDAPPATPADGEAHFAG